MGALTDRLQADRRPVIDADTARILALPRKGSRPSAQALDAVEASLALPGCAYPLLPAQRRALYWVGHCGGLAGIVGVGHGKFLISALAPTVLGAVRPLLLVPARLKFQTLAELAIWRERYRIGDIHVESYAALSTRPALLDEIAPDLIVADECHMLRHRGAARTRRVLRYFRAQPETRFVGLSGTYTSKSLRDYAHLVELALRNASPVPLDYPLVESWSAMVDVGGEPTPYDEVAFAPLLADTEQPVARDALYRLLDRTPGVELTRGQACDASIEIRAIPLALPAEIATALDDLDRDWISPSGENLVDAVRVAAVRRQLLQGFYYRWDWPGGVVDVPWLAARASWFSVVRGIIRSNRRGLDTPAQVAEAIEAGTLTRADAVAAWSLWDAQRAKPAPPVETVWLDPFVLTATAALLRRTGPALVWARSRAMLSGLSMSMPAIPAGDEPHGYTPQLALSVASHGTGLNLQAWNTNILTSVPPGGATVEQLLGRTHRAGQAADEVILFYFDSHDSVRDDWRKVLADAEYVRGTTGASQKCLAARHVRD